MAVTTGAVQLIGNRESGDGATRLFSAGRDQCESRSEFGQGKNATPTILKGPADWRFERLPIPPGFAQDIKWTGFEEARFAPGMFDPSSAN